MPETIKQTANSTVVLPESYTLETGGGILKRQGVNLRHKELAMELTTSESIYKQLLQLPALIIYNQSLIDRTTEANEYLQEQIINIIFAVNEVKAKHPHVTNPLSAKRLDEYDKIQGTTSETSDELFELEKVHNQLKETTYKQLKTQIIEWQKLCKEGAEKLTETLLQQGLKLPENFSDILAKHLQRAGTNKIAPEELKDLSPKGKLSYAEQALFCALKEVNYHG